MLIDRASQFRYACEKYRDEHEYPFASMKYFPRGCCTLASEALLRYLRDEGIDGAELLNYRVHREKMINHDFIYVLDWAIDITADQFPKEERHVVVRKIADLPKTWKPLKRFTLDQLIEKNSVEGECTLLKMYNDIREFIPSTAG